MGEVFNPRNFHGNRGEPILPPDLLQQAVRAIRSQQPPYEEFWDGYLAGLPSDDMVAFANRASAHITSRVHNPESRQAYLQIFAHQLVAYALLQLLPAAGTRPQPARPGPSSPPGLPSQVRTSPFSSQKQEFQRSPLEDADQADLTITSKYAHLLGSHHFDSARGKFPHRLYRAVGLEVRDGCAVATRRRVYGRGSEGAEIERVATGYAETATAHFVGGTPNPDEHEDDHSTAGDRPPENLSQALLAVGSPSSDSLVRYPLSQFGLLLVSV